MRRALALLLLLPGALLPSACAIDFDADFRGGSAACGDAGEQCAVAPPAGWIGPVVLATSQAACPAGASPVASGTSCGACSCTPATTSCSAPVTVYQDQCSGQGSSLGTFASGKCGNADQGGGANHAVAGPAVLTGSCTPAQGAQSSAVVCALQSKGSCGQGACVSKAVSVLCIYEPGIQACPAGPYSVRQVLGSAASSCSACQCGAATGACGGSVTFYDGDGCDGGGGASIPADGTTCGGFNGPKAARYEASPTGVACAPTGGDPSDAATAVTICCSAP